MKEKVKFGDYLIYADSGSYYLESTKFFVDTIEMNNLSILPFTLPDKFEKNYSKRDAFILMDCDSPEYYNTQQRFATYIAFKKTDLTMKFLDEWVYYSEDYRIISNDDNVLGKKNHDPDNFVGNRNDQTVFSLLTKKYKIPYFQDPLKLNCHRKNQDCQYFGLDYCDY